MLFQAFVRKVCMLNSNYDTTGLVTFVTIDINTKLLRHKIKVVSNKQVSVDRRFSMQNTYGGECMFYSLPLLQFFLLSSTSLLLQIPHYSAFLFSSFSKDVILKIVFKVSNVSVIKV